MALARRQHPAPAAAPALTPWRTGSLGGRDWVWRQGEDRIALGLVTRLALPDPVARILAARGLGLDEAAGFLDPTLRALLPDPSTLTDMDPAAERLARAIRAGETVGILADYDVDGACSGAMLSRTLAELGCPVLTHVPDRLLEGYGPNPAALASLAARGATLLVCVDCGTAAHAAFAGAAADILVLDHHKAEGPPPAILATVNPNRLDDASGLRHLCAAGIVFLTLVATLRALRRTGHFAGRAEPDLRRLLDLVALATVCDVVPLAGLNRAFVRQGLAVLRAGPRPGLAALLQAAGTRGEPNAASCGFALGPRINAGGRIGEAGLGLALLLADTAGEAEAISARLEAVNQERRALEAAMLEEACPQADAQAEAGRPVLLVTAPGWHPGIAGIVAARLKDRLQRPALVGGGAEGVIRGSGRSLPGADLGAALIAARQAGLLLTGGGHALAAGFTCEAERLQALHDFLAEHLPAAPGLPARPPLVIEAALTPRAATAELAAGLERLAPFGAANEEPVLVLTGVRAARADWIGRDGATLRAILTDATGARLKSVLFGNRDSRLGAALADRAGPPLDLAGHLRLDRWNGTETPCFTVLDAVPAH